MNEEEFERYKYLTTVLMHMNITPDKLGFDYLRHAVLLVFKDASYLQSITKRLYPDIAKDFGVKSRDVERCIRFAIGQAYNHGGLLEINNLYGAVVYKNDYKLTNRELIGVLADRLVMRAKRKKVGLSIKDLYC